MRLHFVVVVGFVLTSCITSFPAPLQVAIAMNKAVYVAGEPVFVNVTVSNISGSPLTIVVPSVDSCLSAVAVVVEGLPRADLPPCPDPILSSICAYNGPGARQIEILPGKFYEMQRFLGFIYDLQIPGTYRARVNLHLQYANSAPVDQVSAEEKLSQQTDLSFRVVRGDADALRAAFAPILADLDCGDFERQWHAQLVLLNLAPHFAESRILALADRLDVGVEAMPALRKLGTSASIQKLEGIAFEAPDGDLAREQIRWAALDQIRYVDDRSLLPQLYAVMAQQRWQSIRGAAANAAARIAHGEAVPEISRMMRVDSDGVFAGAEALGEAKSREAVEALISAIPTAGDDNELHAIIAALGKLTHRRSSSDLVDGMNIQREWNGWWALHHADAKIYGPDTCGAITPLN
jgi:hypothetical protein